MRWAVVLGSVLVVSAACAPPTPDDIEPTAMTGQSIVNGTASPPANDSTVLLLDGGQPSCTGTLITPNLVLTARHCVTDFNDQSNCGRVIGDAPPSVFTIATGPYGDTKSTARGAKLYVPNSQDIFCNGDDIALILLDADIPNAKTAKVRFTAAAVNEVGTAIGYGQGGGGRRERGDVKVLAIGPSTTTYEANNGYTFDDIRLAANELMSSESTCYGDSGGPLLDGNGEVIGVASEGLDNQCVDRPTFYVGVGKHEQLIKDAATASGHPLGQGSATPADPRSATGEPTDPGKTAANKTMSSGGTSEEEEERKRAKPLGSAGCSTVTTSNGGSALWVELGLAMAAGALIRRRRKP